MKTLVITTIAAVVGMAAALGAQGGQGGTPAQNVPTVRTASITGQVIDGDTGETIGGAVVRLQMRTLAAAAAQFGSASRAFCSRAIAEPRP